MLVPLAGNYENKEAEQEIQRRKGHSLCSFLENHLVPRTSDQK